MWRRKLYSSSSHAVRQPEKPLRLCVNYKGLDGEKLITFFPCEKQNPLCDYFADCFPRLGGEISKRMKVKEWVIVQVVDI